MIDREINAFILRALLRAPERVMVEDTLRSAVRLGFPHVALPATEITLRLRDCETKGWISGSNDELLGIVWGLTPSGLNKAAQLG